MEESLGREGRGGHQGCQWGQKLLGARSEGWGKPTRWHDREAPTWQDALLQRETQDHPDDEHQSHTGTADKGPLRAL